MTIEMMTPMITPIARFPVATTTAAVVTISNISVFGIRLNVEVRSLRQSNVAAATTNMTTTSAAMGFGDTP